MIRHMPTPIARPIVFSIKLWVAALTLLAMVLPGCAKEQEPYQPLRLPRSLVPIDSADSGPGGTSHAILVDKSRQQMVLFSFDGRWKEMARWPCSTGKHEGPKRVEGDGKTPEGVYFATRNVTPPYIAPRYGSRALPLDYPSLIDRQHLRGGSSIWLHGTNQPLIANNSNGCVVLENAHIDQVASYVDLNRTPIIIVGHLTWWTEQTARDTSRKILAAVEQWHEALMHGSYKEYSRWYRSESRPGMQWWQRWCKQRKSHFGGEIRPIGLVRNQSLYRSKDAIVMTFDHLLTADTQQVRVGFRKLYLKLEAGRVRIIGDTYQGDPNPGQDRLFSAWRKLWENVRRKSELATVRQSDNQT
jgi:murein L,D-transpeptidase YafK